MRVIGNHRAAVCAALLIGATALVAAEPWHGPILLTLSTAHGVDTGDLLALPLVVLAIAVARGGAGEPRPAGRWAGAAPALVLGAILMLAGVALTAGGGSLVPAGGGTLDGTIDRTSATSHLPVDRWTDVAVTYDGSRLRLYVDGDEVSSYATGGAVQRSPRPLWIGGNRPYGEHFRGLIDDVRVYDRALSAAEVRADMRTPVRPAAGLAAAYAFDDGSGTSASDGSGRGNAGELRGAVWARGRHGGALRFDGAGAVVRVPPSASLDLGRAMTLSGWVRPTARQTGWRTIVQRQTDAYYLVASSAQQVREGLVDDLRALLTVAAAAWFCAVIALGRGPAAIRRRRTWWAPALLFALGAAVDAAFAQSGTLLGPALVALWLAATAPGRVERVAFAAAGGACLALTASSLLDVSGLETALARDDGAVARTVAVGALLVLAGLARFSRGGGSARSPAR